MEIARDAVNQTWDREGALLDEEERAEGEASVRGHVVDMAVKLARLHHEQVAPQIEPVAVERTFKLELPNHSVDLVGTIDVEERDGIRDHKCFARAPSQFDVDRSLQLTMYALAKRTLDGQEPKRISLDVLVKLKRGPRVETFQTTRGPDDYRALLDRVAVVTHAIEQGVFVPTTPDNWRCSPKWCAYYDICPYAGGRRSTQVPLIRPPSAA
jgi:RecB family exonuclease